MNAYRVTAAMGVHIHGGILLLHVSQARARMHRLTPLGENRYELSHPPVQFKRGETFGFEGNLSKGLGRSVEAIPISVLGKWVHRPFKPRAPVYGEKKRLEIPQAIPEQQNAPARARTAAARAQTLNASKRRWVKRDEAREKVLRDWEKNPSRFRGGAAAGRYYTEWLAKQDYHFESVTVTRWIRIDARLRGIKL
jgi:hypothetical protein